MVPDKSVKCRGQVHIALGMKQEDKRGDIAGLMSGTGRSEKALYSGEGGRDSRQGSVGSPQRCLGLRHGTLPSSELSVVQFVNPGQWGEFSVLKHKWLFGTGQGAVCSTAVRQMERRAGGWFQRCQTQLPPSPGAESHSVHTLLHTWAASSAQQCLLWETDRSRQGWTWPSVRSDV